MVTKEAETTEYFRKFEIEDKDVELRPYSVSR